MMMVEQQRSRARFRTWLRQFNRDIFNRLTLTFAGRHVYAVMHHVGRRTGRAYITPVVALPIADGFIIPLPFGADTDWCRNVLAAGQCTIRWHGLICPVTRPEVVGATTAYPLLPTWARRLLRAFRLQQFLKVYRQATR